MMTIVEGGGWSRTNKNMSSKIALSAASFLPFGTSTSLTPVLWHPSLTRRGKALKSPKAEKTTTEEPERTGWSWIAVRMLLATSSGRTSLGTGQFSMSHRTARGGAWRLAMRLKSLAKESTETIAVSDGLQVGDIDFCIIINVFFYEQTNKKDKHSIRFFRVWFLATDESFLQRN